MLGLYGAHLLIRDRPEALGLFRAGQMLAIPDIRRLPLGSADRTAHVDTANPAASKVEVTIQAGSIDTGNADRNGHRPAGGDQRADHEAVVAAVADIGLEAAEAALLDDQPEILRGLDRVEHLDRLRLVLLLER